MVSVPVLWRAPASWRLTPVGSEEVSTNRTRSCGIRVAESFIHRFCNNNSTQSQDYSAYEGEYNNKEPGGLGGLIGSDWLIQNKYARDVLLVQFFVYPRLFKPCEIIFIILV